MLVPPKSVGPASIATARGPQECVEKITQEALQLLNTENLSYPRVLVPPVLQLLADHRSVLKITEETLQLLLTMEATLLKLTEKGLQLLIKVEVTVSVKAQLLSCTMLRIT